MEKNYRILTTYYYNEDVVFANDRFTHDFDKAKSIMEEEFEKTCSEQLDISVLALNEEDWKLQQTEKSIILKSIFTNEELSITIEEFTFES